MVEKTIFDTDSAPLVPGAPIHSLFAGSFDPPTLGHMAIAAEALMGADELTLLIGFNPSKAGAQMFTPEERVQMFRNTIQFYIDQHAGKNDGTVACKIADALKNGEKRIRLVTDPGLTIAASEREGACKMIRGLRPNGKDLDEENTYAYINHRLVTKRGLAITTAMVAAPDPQHYFVASSTTKGILGSSGDAGDLEDFVTPDVAAAMEQRNKDLAARKKDENAPLNPLPTFETYATPDTITPTGTITGFMPGDFTLFTNAHLDVAMRSLAGLDKLVIGVNEKKGDTYFKFTERVEMIRKSIEDALPKMRESKDPVLRKVAKDIDEGRKSFDVVSYSGPFLTAAKEQNASIITRGLHIGHLTSEASMAQILRIESDDQKIPVSIEHIATPVALYQQLDTARVVEAFEAFGAESASAKTMLPDAVREALAQKLQAATRLGPGNGDKRR